MVRTIGILIFPDFQLLDAAGPISVFEVASRFARQRTAIKPLALQAGLVRSSSGVEMMAQSIKNARARPPRHRRRSGCPTRARF